MAISVKGSLLPSGLDTPLNERSRVETRSELSNIQNPSIGETVYIKDEKKTYQIDSLQYDDDLGTYYITEENISSLGGGADVYFSEDGVAPENINTIWVDGADNQEIDASTFDRIRTELNKLDNRLSNIEYAFDVKLDSGDTTYYKGSEFATMPGVSPETSFDLVLTFTYDGDEFTFTKNTYDGVDITTLGTKFVLSKDGGSGTTIAWTDARVRLSSDKTTCYVSSMNQMEFDKFQLYNGDAIVYEAELSSAGLVADEPTWADKLQPNVHHICIKRAKTETALSSYTPQDGELIYSMETNKLYIGNDGRLATIGGGSSSSSTSNVTNEYIDLLATDGVTVYRVKVDAAGNLFVKPKAYYDNPEQEAGAAGAFNLIALRISSIYAGPEGADATSNNICSHSYIELYNSRSASISLNGVSLCIGTNTWQKVISLRGAIAGKHCYLIRLNPVSNPESADTKILIDNYDLDAYALDNEIKISSAGFKAYLCINASAPSINNPWDATNQTVNSSIIGYIDLVGAINATVASANSTNAAEAKSGANPPAILSDERGIFRYLLGDANAKTHTYSESGSGDTNNNEADFRPFSWSSNVSPLTGLEMWDIEDLKPWCLADGEKDMYFYKNKFKSSKPNMPTVTTGELPSTRRFNWISTTPQEEYVYYRKQGASDWVAVKSGNETNYGNLRITGNDGVGFNVHKATVNDLTAGTYEWYVGNASGTYKSDTFTFVITEGSLNLLDGGFRFCQVSDQQGWAFGEYEPWNLAMKQIIDNFNAADTSVFPSTTENSDGSNRFELLLNTGDMTQNGLRPSEWIDYYNCGQYLSNIIQMNCVGNNDLCPGTDENGNASNKVNPDTFIYFYNYEYSNDAEEQALQKYGNGFMKSVYAFDYGCVHFICLNSNNYIEEQKAWFNKHIENLNARETQPKWRIVYVHDAPFNIMTKSPNNDSSGSFYVDITSDPTAGGLRDTKMNQRDKVGYEFTWSRLFETADIDLVLSGHKHTYSRSYPVIENTIDEDLSNTAMNTYNLQVNPWKPLYNSSEVDRVAVTEVQVGEETKKGVIYVMSQATGFKLQSNKDIPAPGIEWLAKYFPGSISGTKITVDSLQKAPTFIMWDVTSNQIHMETYQVNAVTDGSSWDSLSGGQKGTTVFDNIKISKIDEIKIVK